MILKKQTKKNKNQLQTLYNRLHTLVIDMIIFIN